MPGAAWARDVLHLRVGTTIAASGLADVLLPAFEKDTGLVVELTAGSSGLSLQDAREGRMDALLVNAPAAEEAFMADGSGIVRKTVMADHYVIVGPKDDPAGVAGARSASEAFKRIEHQGSTFVSRSDDSGNNQTELSIWRQAGVEPYGTWYFETGQGVADSLHVAEERQAYMLVDWSTWLKRAGDAGDGLTVLYDGSRDLPNRYCVIAVNPETQPGINLERAQRLVDWLTSPRAQTLIGDYQINGQHPFAPAHAGRD